MTRAAIAVRLLFCLTLPAAWPAAAQLPATAEPADTRPALDAWPPGQLETLAAGARPGRQILVTFPDPNAGQPDLSGRPGPRYLRRGEYRVSTGVRQAARRLAGEFELDALADWPIRPLQLYCLVYDVPEHVDLDELLDQLAERPEIGSAERLNVFETLSGTRVHYDDPYADLQHALDTLQLPEAHLWSDGRGVDVSIIDTGADLRHPELRGRITAHRDFVNADAEGFTADRHGTAVSGVIGASANNGVGMVGVAPAARLRVLKACWHTPGQAAAACNSFTLAQALSRAIEAGTQVINLSLTGPRDTLLTWLVENALERNITVVAAAPKDAQAQRFPSDVPGVIVVDVLDPSRAGAAAGAGHASTLRAPGEDILVTIPGAAFDFESGSSLAAAHVTGVVALLLARKPGLHPRAVHHLLNASRGAVQDSVNACRALAELVAGVECTPGGALPTRFDPLAPPSGQDVRHMQPETAHWVGTTSATPRNAVRTPAQNAVDRLTANREPAP